MKNGSTEQGWREGEQAARHRSLEIGASIEDAEKEYWEEDETGKLIPEETRKLRWGCRMHCR